METEGHSSRRGERIDPAFEKEVRNMTYYNEELKLLKQQTARKHQLEAQLADLQDQSRRLKNKVRQLGGVLAEEDKDVQQLEGWSLKALFYGAIGKMDEKLDQERAQAYAARLKYDAALREQGAVEEDIRQARQELKSLEGCEARYELLLREKAAALKSSGSPAVDRIIALEERLTVLESRKQELTEAVWAGNDALKTVQKALKCLDSAGDLAVWDAFGGGMLVDMAKHDQLDDAQRHINELQSRLRRFRTELADVTIEADIQIGVDGFLHFADFFFDGFFSSMAVMDRITEAQNKVKETKRRVREVLSVLEGMLADNTRETEANRAMLEELIVQA